LRTASIYLADILFWTGAALCLWRALWLEWIAMTARWAPRRFRRQQARLGVGWVLMAGTFVVLAVL